MFKKPLGNLKASGPLPELERGKVKQRVVATFGVSQDEGDQLVPEGLQSIRFSTYLNKQGVAYLGPEGDPLWFTIGKCSNELIPTVYTLWKKRNLVPFVSTQPSVTRVLIGGAAHGVIQRPTQSIAKDQLVSICQYDCKEGMSALSVPLVIGRMAISSDRMTAGGKEKAIIVLHAWKDHLWDIGSKPDMPEPTVMAGQELTRTSSPSPSPHTTIASHTPQEITDILHKSLLQSISTIFSSLPVSGFPIPSTQFYTNHILPSRPGTTTHDVTIKNSTYKSLTAFLKAAEKDSLLTLKSPQKQKGLLVMSVNKAHSSVLGHVNYETVKDVEEKVEKAKREMDKTRSTVLGRVNFKTVKDAEEKNTKQEEMENDRETSELSVRLLWKPHLDSAHLFESIGGDPNTLYTMQEIKTLLDSYISSRNLDKTKDKAYINLDNLLRECIYAKRQSKQAIEDEDASLLENDIEREELVKKVVAKMQDWYEIVRDGETSLKKGTLKPIQVQVVTTAREGKIKRKSRRGRIKVIRVVTKEAKISRRAILNPIQVFTKPRHGKKDILKPKQVFTKGVRHGRKSVLKPRRFVVKEARYGRKGTFKPNQVVTKASQDRKVSEFAKIQYSYKVVRTRKASQKKRKGTLKPQETSTYVTGFEPFLTVGAETVANELRWVCESATSVWPLPEKEAGMKVVVQGKHSKVALEFLTSHGVPKQWIELVDS